MDNRDVSPLISLCYDLLVKIADDRILATHGSKISLITLDGIMICTYDLIMIPTMEDTDYIFNEIDNVEESTAKNIEDYLLIISNGKCGLIDYDGNLVIEPIYRDITFDSKGRAELLP